MYQGLDKCGGGVVGSSSSAALTQDFNDVCQVSSAEEILVCEEEGEDGEPRKVFVTASLNTYNGSVVWNKDYDEEKVMRRTIGMSQMTSMLHDQDRNGVYERSIALSIRYFIKQCGRAPTVLDIGTGTGKSSALYSSTTLNLLTARVARYDVHKTWSRICNCL